MYTIHKKLTDIAQSLSNDNTKYKHSHARDTRKIYVVRQKRKKKADFARKILLRNIEMSTTSK